MPKRRRVKGFGESGPLWTLPGWALRRAWAEDHSPRSLVRDAMAGLVVGVVALPLSMALAIASGVPPQQGLYTAIVAGGLIALLGGSRTQVSGPTAAFVVILAPISGTFGLGGLLLATAMAGLILIGLAAARAGKLLQYIPYPVTAGFTAGIGVVMALLQLRDFLGLRPGPTGSHAPDLVMALVRAAGTISPTTVLVGAVTLAILLVWPRLTRRLPAPLVALPAGAALAHAIASAGGPELATIGSRFSFIGADGVVFSGIPPLPPAPVLPWQLAGGDGAPLGLSLEVVRALLPSALAIALLGAIESLLSAVVADGMTEDRHEPNAELLAQGVGNLVAPFFGGIAATGAIARTATNVRAGGRSPLAGVVHSAFVLAAMMGLAPVLGYLPMASLAALLLVTAWNMSEARHVVHVVRTAPRSDVLVLLVCLSLTVIFDMVIAVVAGVVLAALLFMRRMAELGSGRLLESDPHRHATLPPGLMVYEIAGPLFFGAASRAMHSLEAIGDDARVVLMDLRAVPAIDATGLVNLESAARRLRASRVVVVLAGLQEQPHRALVRARLTEELDVHLHPDLGAGLQAARNLLGRPAVPTGAVALE